MSVFKKKKTADKLTERAIADFHDVIVRPVVTEKSTMASEQNKVTFMISPRADKIQVKQAVEHLFKVKVEKVNTVNIAGKTKRFRGQKGKRDDVRKAIVTLKEGQTIDLAAGL